jgi:aspartate ammonia-lyase
VKLADFLNSFSSAMSQQKTAMEKLQDAINEVNMANDAISTTVSSFNDLDLTELFGSSEIDFKKNDIGDYVDLESIANANPITEILNPIKGMANLFKFDIF